MLIATCEYRINYILFHTLENVSSPDYSTTVALLYTYIMSTKKKTPFHSLNNIPLTSRAKEHLRNSYL